MAREERLPGRSLFESERRFRLLVEGVIDYAIYMLDPDGIITNWNAGAKRIKGYDAEEVLGRHFGMFYLPEDREAGLPERALQTARDKGKFEAEGWRLRKDGTRFLASVVIDALYENGELVGFAKITRDITERSIAAEALKESDRHFRLLVSGVTDYALYMLDPTGVVTNWNTGGERIKGYFPEEIIGQHFSRFYTTADQAAGRPARALRLAVEHGRYEEEGWRVRKDGTLFWASVIIDPIRDDEQRLIGFAKITRDISERREAQLAMEKIQRQLAESQKLDALGQLTGGVAHDFNNLLMVITGSLHMLKKSAGSDPKLLRAAQAIETATSRGAALTRQLLTFARRQSVHPQTIDLTEQIYSVREVLDTGIGSAVELRIDVEDGIWPITVDPAEFETALVNLVINARDAMPRGGSVSIRARNIFIDDGERKGDHVAITVSGYRRRHSPRHRCQGVRSVLHHQADRQGDRPRTVPGPRLRASGRRHGRGGKRVGQRHVLYHLPAAQRSDNRPLRMKRCRARSAAAPCFWWKTIPMSQPRASACSSNWAIPFAGCRMRRRRSRRLERNGIDLVFSDIVMPGKMDGLDLARTIREKHPDLPVLLASGYSDAAQNARSEFPILRKPYQIHELNQALSQLVA